MSLNNKNHLQTQLYLTHGYIRENTEHLSMLFPFDINDLIYEYLKQESFEWDIETFPKYEIVHVLPKGDKAIFEKGTIIGTGDTYTICASKNVISSKFYDKFYFELTIGKQNDNIAVMMGFMKYPILDEIIQEQNIKGNYSYLGKSHQGHQWGLFAHYDYNDRYSVYDGNEYTVSKTLLLDNGKHPKCGDRFGFQIDFISKTCKAFKNDEYMGVITDEVPSEIVVAVSTYATGVMSCTRFEPIIDKKKE